MRLFRWGFALAFIAMAAMPLASCKPPAIEAGSGVARSFDRLLDAVEAPLDRTVIDDQSVTLAFSAFDALLSLVDARVASGDLIYGSPRALDVQRHLIDARAALNAASSAQRRGSAADALAAFRSARTAIRSARAAFARSQ